MTEFFTQNNVKAVINQASMADALNLKRVFFKELANGNIDINNIKNQIEKSGSIQDLIKKFDFNTIINAAFNIMGSEELDSALIQCLSKSTYNKEKININTFDDEKAREDYYELIIKCAEINLAPFMKGLVSALQGLGNKLQSEPVKSQKS